MIETTDIIQSQSPMKRVLVCHYEEITLKIGDYKQSQSPMKRVLVCHRRREGGDDFVHHVAIPYEAGLGLSLRGD